jgi:hypothetical protein
MDRSNVSGEWSVLMILIRGVRGSSLGPVTGRPDLPWFPESLEPECRDTNSHHITTVSMSSQILPVIRRNSPTVRPTDDP